MDWSCRVAMRSTPAPDSTLLVASTSSTVSLAHNKRSMPIGSGVLAGTTASARYCFHSVLGSPVCTWATRGQP